MAIERAPETMTPDPEPAAPNVRGAEQAELWSWLPRFSARQIRLAAHVARWTAAGHSRPWMDWLGLELSQAVAIGQPEIVQRASGLLRPGLIAQLRWPRFGTRLAIGLEVSLAHALVDLLLGYERPQAESRLQLTPVEWGVWSYALARALNALNEPDGTPVAEASTTALDPSDLILDRVGPDAFRVDGLGAITTVLWPVRVRSTTGTVRLWLPETVANLVLAAGPPGPSTQKIRPLSSAGQLTSLWRATAGEIPLPQGLRRLRKGGVLPLADTRLSGTPQSLTGTILLVCDQSDPDLLQCVPAKPAAASGGRLLHVSGPREVRLRPRHATPSRIEPRMSTNAPQPADRDAAMPTDIPVTLTVELGRVSLSLARVADLKTGDVIELGRHSREPVELTSNGRVVARGELILIDTEMGVRVTQLFL